MKQIFTIVFAIATSHSFYSQSMGSINSGAVSSNTLIYSVGEVFVLPSNPNEASSGVIGALSYIEFTTLGINDIEVSEKIRFYPNPTADSVFFKIENGSINTIFIYDIKGSLLETIKVTHNKVSLFNLQAGTYLIKTDNQSIKSFKIIKK